MKVALVQLDYHIGNISGNRDKIVSSIERAKGDNVDLVLFSELSVTGYYPDDLLEKRAFIDRVNMAIATIISASKDIAVVVGAPTINPNSCGKRLYNSALFIADGELKQTVHKTLLPTYDIFDEYRHFESNDSFSLVEYKGCKIALTICEDIWDDQPTDNSFLKEKLYKVNPLEELSKLNPDVIINISASPFSYTQVENRKHIICSKAKSYSLPVLYVNQVGANTEILFDGGSMCVDSRGEVKSELSYFSEDYRVVDLSALTELNEEESELDYIQKIHDALVMGIRGYFGKMGFKKATLGLSGGIDSAVTVALAAEALGADNIDVLMLPSKYSSDHSITDAVELAETLNIRYEIVKINDIVDKFESAMSNQFRGREADVTEENIQARTRGTLMMALSNKFGHILLNTSNKSEAAVGYSTLYGDMNGGLSILGDVYKSDVFKLAYYINRDREIIPINTIVKPPSAELRLDQKDSDSLPDYDILDKILFGYIECMNSVDELVEAGFDRDVVEKVLNLVDRSEYKRFQTPPILRVSSKAFGFGRKMPLVGHYR